MKRFLCRLRGHRTTIRPVKAQPLATALTGEPWRIFAHVSCWCGQIDFYEGDRERS